MDKEDMDDKEEEQSAESRAVRMGQRRMMTPTQVEWEEPERTHVPYRSWCRTLRSSTGKQSFQRRLGRVNKDHCFMRDQPGMVSAKILVSKDHGTRMVSAHVVPIEGSSH